MLGSLNYLKCAKYTKARKLCVNIL